MLESLLGCLRVVWSGVEWYIRSCNESLHVHIMLHSSEISFGYAAQGGFSADLQI